MRRFHWTATPVWHAVYDEELAVISMQNELAKLEVDILNTQAHNERLEETLKLMDDELRSKAETISKYEVSCILLAQKNGSIGMFTCMLTGGSLCRWHGYRPHLHA